MSDPSERLHAMLARVCFGKDAALASAAEPAVYRAFLEGHGLAPEDVEALVAAPRRLGLYRQLVRHNVTSVVGTMLARTRARLEIVAPGAWDETLDGFMDDVGPRTPHLRDVPAELLAYAAPRWRDDARLPAWVSDFATYELLDFTVGVAPRGEVPTDLEDVAADRALVFAAPSERTRLAWAVHCWEPAPEATSSAAPEERDVELLVYRDAEHQTRFLELTPLAALILDELFSGEPLARAMVKACERRGRPLDDDVLGGAARLLADLADRGVLLGAKK